MNENTYETFFAGVRNSGSNTLELTIDKRVAKYMGLEVGDTVKVMIKKAMTDDDGMIEI